jgi:translation initiation factor IF-2
MGHVATVVVRNGSINVGQTIYAEEVLCKVRGLFNDLGKPVKEVLPGFPAKVLGFSEVPPVGAVVSNEPKAAIKEIIKPRNVFEVRRLKNDEVPVIIKASNAGALEAIIASLPPKIIVVDRGVGEINSSDVINAKTGNATIFAFESKISNDILKLAEAEKITIASFKIIYELLQAAEELLTKGKVVEVGRAQVMASFPFNDKRVAGSKVISGRVSKGDKLILMRGEKEMGKSKVVSLRKQKLEVGSVGPSEEFGLIMEPQLDFQSGDTLVSIR